MGSQLMIRTTSANSDFQELVRALDIDLKLRDGEDHAFFAQFNKIDALQHVVVVYSNAQPVGCGAIKELDPTTAEVKRMYVTPEFRGIGHASSVLKELETWAAELGFTRCILETGEKQPEAIALYSKNRYHVISNYGQYARVETSVCFEKALPL